MTEEPADIDLDKSGPEDSGGVTPRSRRAGALLAIVAILIVGFAVGYRLLRRPPSAISAPAAGSKPSGTPPSSQAEQITLPPLDETDALVRQLVGRLSSHPAVASWLTTDGLILNFVVVTARIADGETPVAELKAIGPVAPPFHTRKVGDGLYSDPSNYHRYDRFAEAVSSLDARGTARLYTTLKPRIREGYQRLGSRGEEFDVVLERAIIELLEVPIVSGDVTLKPKGIGYAFADPRLERLSPAQKQFLRMGPQNVRTVQAKLREIATGLGIPESRLPKK